MKHTEAKYFDLGYRYEKATNPDKARAVAQEIRAFLSGENPKDVTEARSLIEKGRAEARK